MAPRGKRAAPRPDTPGITRVDQPSTRTHGYVVRVDFRRTEKGFRPKHSAYFGDVSYGGAEKSLAAARSWLRGLRRTGQPPKKKKPTRAVA